jgi:hypothetical protein
VPEERLAQRRRGAEKDPEDTPCLVFSASLRLCAKKSLRECVILTDCRARKTSLPLLFVFFVFFVVKIFLEWRDGRAQRRDSKEELTQVIVLALVVYFFTNDFLFFNLH